MRLVDWFWSFMCRLRGHNLIVCRIVDPDDYIPTGEHYVACLRCGELWS